MNMHVTSRKKCIWGPKGTPRGIGLKFYQIEKKSITKVFIYTGTYDLVIIQMPLLQGGPYMLGRSSSLKALKSGPKDMGHPLGPKL